MVPILEDGLLKTHRMELACGCVVSLTQHVLSTEKRCGEPFCTGFIGGRVVSLRFLDDAQPGEEGS